MIEMKELRNRIYKGRECISFDYILRDNENKECLVAKFSKVIFKDKSMNQWEMQIVLKRTRDADSQVYAFSYVLPKNNMPITFIAGVGLKYFKLYIDEEVQKKTVYQMLIDEKTKDM